MLDSMPTDAKQESVNLRGAENQAISEEEPSHSKSVSTPLPTAAEARAAGQSTHSAPPSMPIRTTVAAVVLIACVAVASAMIVRKLHRPKVATLEPASSLPGENPVQQPEIPANGTHAPGVVATEDELANPWSSKRFTYRDPIIGADVPAMVVRLPNGGYWGFSLVDPVHDCQLEYVTDPNRLNSFYHFQSDHPMVGDPCNLAVFDLLQYSGPRDAEVRGAPVNGIGVRAPIAIEIEQNGKNILATKME